MSSPFQSSTDEQSFIQGTVGKMDEVESSEHSEADDNFDIPTPPKDWHFNNFLFELAEEISKEEFKKLKEIFRDIIGHALLQDIQEPTELFRILRQRRYLSRDNLLYLQAIIMKLQRPELIHRALQYARDEDECIHFYPASDQPENGFRYVKFHVEGKDFKSCSRGYVQKLRNCVARILLIPPECVLIAGVEPSSSMLITLMIPELYVSALETLLQDNPQDLQELCDLEIDTIAINEDVHNIHGVTDVEVVETEQQAKLVSVYQQLQNKTHLLEEREMECLKLSRRVKHLETQQLQDQMETKVLSKMFNEIKLSEHDSSSEGRTPANLASQSSLALFKRSLKQVEERGYDRKLLGQLLAANTDVVVTRMQDRHKINTEQLKLVIQDLQSQIIPQQLERELLKFQVDHDTLKNILMDFLQTLRQMFRVDVELTQQGIELLKKITHKLRDKEKQKLLKQYDWPPGDKLKAAMDNDPNLLLACVYLKEVEKTQKAVDCETFISKCLVDVGRPELKKKFSEMVNRIPLPRKPGSIPVPPQQAHPGSAASVPPGTQIDMVKMSGQIDEIHQKVGGMHDLIRKSQVSYGDVWGETNAPKSWQFEQAFPSWETV